MKYIALKITSNGYMYNYVYLNMYTETCICIHVNVYIIIHNDIAIASNIQQYIQ